MSDRVQDVNRLTRLADDIYTAQDVATICDYDDDAERYADACLELADENGWLDGLDQHDRQLVYRTLVELGQDDVQLWEV